MRYRGFEITSCPDSDVERYSEITKQAERCPGFFCEVYPAGDNQYANRLDYFCLAEGYEIEDTSNEALTGGIMQYVDANFSSLFESKNEVAKNRTEELVGRLVCWLGENEIGKELYHTLSEVIGMTDQEINAVGFSSLVPYFDRERYAQTIAEWIIDDGTDSTLTGNWIVPYGNIRYHFGVNLETDTELREMISRELYNSSDAVADFCMESDKVCLDFYYAYCHHVPKSCDDGMQTTMN